MNTMKWLIKREFWEHKGAFVWTPLAIGAITFFVSAMVLISGPHYISSEKNIAVAAMTIAAFPILFSTYCVSLFYLAGALYEERKNRSVLFWKSLPISDTATVLSKAATALIVAPALAYTIAIGFGYLLLMLCAMAPPVVYAMAPPFFHQANLGTLFDSAALVQIPLLLLGTLPVYALWALPTVGALLLVSALARSNPLFWVVALPLALGASLSWLNHSLGLTENMAWYWTDIVNRGFFSNMPFSWLATKQSGGFAAFTTTSGPEISTQLSSWFSSSWHPLTTPNLWIGVAAGSAMLYAAIRVRRWKDEG
jgi:ABC-2 type transport system permease protein